MIRSLAVALFAGLVAVSGASAETVTRPEAISFGASHAEMTERLDSLCTTADSRVIDPPFLPGVEDEQLQIDCDGFDYMGEPRWAEFVIRDDILEMVWVMVDADDEDRIIAAMREAYDAPGVNVEGMIYFPEHRTGWRFEPPEVLFYSDSLAPLIDAEIAANRSE